MEQKLEVLRQVFGYPSFRPGQEELMDALLSRRDAVGIMPTGAGKSLCYQIPALLFPGLTLVVSPLISLMKDQVGALVQNGIRGAYLNSSLTYRQYRAALRNARNGVYKIIYVAPERLLTPEFLDFAQNAPISMVTVDEAHCVSQWGQDFRPSYLTIPEFLGKLPSRPVVSAFTATATPKVREDILSLLDLQDPFVSVTSFDRPNLSFQVLRPKSKLPQLLSLLKERRGQSGIVYCATRKGVEEVCAALRERGFPATRYHAGLSDGERQENQEDFLYDRAPVMVATNAFGMGIDKSNVSFVIHYNMPKDLESYYQEAGRAGRDGSPAACILLYSRGDVALNRFLLTHSDEGGYVEEELLEELTRQNEERLRAMEGYCLTTACLREYLLHYFGEQAPTQCGNCGNCLGRFVEEDVTPQAREVLSCVRFLRQRYGVTLVTEVLRGSKSEKVLRLGFQKLPCYGSLRALSASALRDLISALVLQDYLTLSPGEYPTLSLGPRAGSVLQGRENVRLRVREGEASPVRAKTSGPLPQGDPELYQRLWKLRIRLSRIQNVPTYVIFSNASLQAMAALQPCQPQEFLEIPGVGQAKLQRYGKAFLGEIRQWKQERESSAKQEGEHGHDH